MNSFRIFETERFQKDLEKDFRGQGARIKKKMETYVYPQLKQQPYSGKNIKKLVNYKPETWRYRIGDWRFFYAIDGKKKIVFMIAADSRGEAY